MCIGSYTDVRLLCIEMCGVSLLRHKDFSPVPPVFLPPKKIIISNSFYFRPSSMAIRVDVAGCMPSTPLYCFNSNTLQPQLWQFILLVYTRKWLLIKQKFILLLQRGVCTKRTALKLINTRTCVFLFWIQRIILSSVLFQYLMKRHM